MPPKKQTKNEKKKAQKVVEDKTFGMKNKNKSAKAQRYIQQLQSQAKHNATQNVNRLPWQPLIGNNFLTHLLFYSIARQEQGEERG